MKKVLTAGTFDLFHIGHLNILRRSKELGDILIVGVSTDELVKKYKYHYPVIPFIERYQIISRIEGVDMVYEQKELLPKKDLDIFNPDIVTLGSDWKNKDIQSLNEYVEEGGEVHYIPYTDGVNTTDLRGRILAI